LSLKRRGGQKGSISLLMIFEKRSRGRKIDLTNSSNPNESRLDQSWMRRAYQMMMERRKFDCRVDEPNITPQLSSDIVLGSLLRSNTSTCLRRRRTMNLINLQKKNST